MSRLYYFNYRLETVYKLTFSIDATFLLQIEVLYSGKFSREKTFMNW